MDRARYRAAPFSEVVEQRQEVGRAVEIAQLVVAPAVHIGVYGYRRATLLRLAGLAPTPLERAESLEQLRALEHGISIRVLDSAYVSLSVDTPDDLVAARRQDSTT